MLLASKHLWLGYHAAARSLHVATLDLYLLAHLSVVRQLAAKELERRRRQQLQQQQQQEEAQVAAARVAELLYETVYTLTNKYFQVGIYVSLARGVSKQRGQAVVPTVHERLPVASYWSKPAARCCRRRRGVRPRCTRKAKSPCACAWRTSHVPARHAS